MTASDLAVGHSLWLVPSEPERSRLTNLIDQLAERLGTPAFEPHLTLLGGFGGEPAALVRHAQELAAVTPALALRLVRPEHGERFFRCLYACVESSPQLARAHARARVALAFDPTEPFLPHLSLIYAELPPTTRETLAGELELPLAGFALACRELWLVQTEGRCEDWRTLARFPLAGAD